MYCCCFTLHAFVCHVFCFGIIWAIFVSKQVQFCYLVICNCMCHISELTVYPGQLAGEWNFLYLNYIINHLICLKLVPLLISIN